MCAAGPPALHDYLCGKWTLEKKLDYTRGGKTGTFSGTASFEPFEGAEGGARTLAYAEEGVATLMPERVELQAYKKLLWEFAGDGTTVRVSFDEATDRSVSGIVAGARFFHSIALPTDPNEQPPPFEHP